MGGAEVLIFCVTSNLFISASFRDTLTIKIFKIIFMIRAIDWRALYGRARGCAREKRAPTRPTLKKLAKSSYYKVGRVGARFSRAQPRARPYSARQSIALIMKMILNILIVSVSLKLAEINRLEVTKKKINTFAPPMSPINGI